MLTRQHAVLGGIAERVAHEITERTGRETRSLLGHLQRGGSPVTSDRLLAQRLGCSATRFMDETNLSGMVAVIGSEIRLLPLEDLVIGPRLVEPDSDLIRTGRELNLCFGDEAPGAFGGVPEALAVAQ